MEIHERLSMIRKELKMTTRGFANKLSISGSLVTGMEKGRRAITDRTINDIYRVFNVNQNWLRTGNGEIFNPIEDINFDDYIKLKGATPIEIEIMKSFLDIDPDDREKIIPTFKVLLNMMQDDAKTTKDQTDNPTDEMSATSQDDNAENIIANIRIEAESTKKGKTPSVSPEKNIDAV